MKSGSCLLDDQEVHYRISGIDDLPPLPGALQRLMEIIHDEVASPRELESLILYDQSLTARILRIANSTYYGRRGEVRTVARAVINLGFEKVKSICLCAMLVELFADKKALSPGQREMFWKHAFIVARICREIASGRPWIDKEDAYLLGLLHDIGKVVMAVYFPDHFRNIQSLAEKRGLPWWYVECQYGLAHTDVGKWAAIRWGFHEALQRVLEFHHTPDRSTSCAPEAKMVYLADVLAHSEEYPQFVDDPCTIAICSDLYISLEEWNEHCGGLSDIRLEVNQLWNLLG